MSHLLCEPYETIPCSSDFHDAVLAPLRFLLIAIAIERIKIKQSVASNLTEDMCQRVKLTATSAWDPQVENRRFSASGIFSVQSYIFERNKKTFFFDLPIPAFVVDFCFCCNSFRKERYCRARKYAGGETQIWARTSSKWRFISVIDWK